MLYALLILVIADVVVHAASSSLPAPLLWSAPEFPVKEAQIDHLAAKGGASVMFVGSSTMDVSMNPSGLPPLHSRRPPYNAATGGATIGMIDVWTRLVAAPKLHPDIAVVGVVTRELNENDPQQIELDKGFSKSVRVHRLLHRESTREVIERHVSDVSAIFKFRTVLNQPKRVLDTLFTGKYRSGEFGEIVSDDGQYEAFLNVHLTNHGAAYRDLRATGLHNFKIGAAKVATLRRMLTALAARHIKVVVVNMPVTQVYVEAHPRGKADYDAGVSTLRREARRVGAQFVDVGVWPDRYFADSAHVDALGSRRFTRLIGGVLARLGA